MNSHNHARVPALEPVFELLRQILLDGIRHGYFDCTINCRMTNHCKRELVVKSGKSHQFVIREEDLAQL